MENKLFTIVNKADETSFLQDLKQHPNNFKKKLIFVFGNSENYIVVNGKKFLPQPAPYVYEYVDLGLPSGLKWATCNVGATSPEEYGLYFAWGETTGYTADDVTSGVRLFTEDEYNAGPAASISADLTLEQDAAHVNMGENWRMPTDIECYELIDNCNAIRTEDYNGTGVAGMMFTSKTNGKSVFFPAASNYDNSHKANEGLGEYLLANWDSSYVKFLFFGFNSPDISLSSSKYSGRTIRGVCE